MNTDTGEIREFKPEDFEQAENDGWVKGGV